MILKNNTYLDRSEFKKSLKKSHLYVIPIGGCGMFGMNMTCYIYDGKMIVVDAGSLFPDSWMLGISMIIPDPGFWIFEEFDLLAYVITHAHEDHIGALPYLMKQKAKPVYATQWTSEVLQRRFSEHVVDTTLVTVTPNESVNIGPFQVKFLPIGHSIPDAASLLITSGKYKSFHSGDFKFDSNQNKIPDSLKELSSANLDLFICDSTNSEKDGFCPPEDTVCDPLRKIIAEAKGNVYLASFSSNVMRFKWVGDICKDLKKNLYVSGTSLKNNFELAKKLGMLPEGFYKEENEAEAVLKKSVVLISGCQGEYRSALARLANNEHRFFQLQEDDVIVFSSRVIPGNEKNLSDLIDKLRRSNVRIISPKNAPDIHVSGHAFGGEIKKLLEFAKPKTFIPVHGTYSHQLASYERNHQQNSLLVKNGSIVQQGPKGSEILGNIKIDTVYVDDEYQLLLNRFEFLERIRLSKKGMATLSGIISAKKLMWMRGPVIRISGLNQDEEWIIEITQALKKYLSTDASNKDKSPEMLTQDVKEYWENLLVEYFGSKPIVYSDIWVLDSSS